MHTIQITSARRDLLRLFDGFLLLRGNQSDPVVLRRETDVDRWRVLAPSLQQVTDTCTTESHGTTVTNLDTHNQWTYIWRVCKREDDVITTHEREIATPRCGWNQLAVTSETLGSLQDSVTDCVFHETIRGGKNETRTASRHKKNHGADGHCKKLVKKKTKVKAKERSTTKQRLQKKRAETKAKAESSTSKPKVREDERKKKNSKTCENILQLSAVERMCGLHRCSSSSTLFHDTPRCLGVALCCAFQAQEYNPQRRTVSVRPFFKWSAKRHLAFDCLSLWLHGSKWTSECDWTARRWKEERTL